MYDKEPAEKNEAKGKDVEKDGDTVLRWRGGRGLRELQRREEPCRV